MPSPGAPKPHRINDYCLKSLGFGWFIIEHFCGTIFLVIITEAGDNGPQKVAKGKQMFDTYRVKEVAEKQKGHSTKTEQKMSSLISCLSNK